MSKLFLEVEVPGIAKTYEFTADSSMTVKKVKEAIIAQIETLENHSIFHDKDEVLFCSADLKGLLQEDEILRSVGVKSGGKIILL